MSRLNQIEDWQQYQDPNNVSVDRVNRSKRIIREVPIEEDGSNYNNNFNSSVYQPEVYKLLLRDFSNNYCYAYEYNDPLRFIRESREETFTPLKIKLGGRLRVKPGAKVINGVIYLDNSFCQYLGLIDQDKELTDNLNTGIVQRYIEILTEGLTS
ncbi:hypothetical protein DFJ63DRAFT_332437 [Scheffersomyces coipomensis]|uniref:uncharacterized protein n=1 Tax=Scheffersomyces coipomensis TaxID=1788519 RepID=UPI00315CE12E